MTYGGLLNKETSEDYSYKNLSQKLYPEYPFETLPDWGCLLHPDEVRKVLIVGNGRLVTVDGSQIEDNQLKNWIDLTVEAFQNMLGYDIYPRLWRSRPTVFERQPKIIEPYAEWEDHYDYKPSESSLHFVKLRHKPVMRVLKFDFVSPYSGNTIINLLPRVLIKHNSGIIKSTYYIPFHIGGQIQSTPVGQYRLLQSGTNQYPNSYHVDYVSGYDSAQRVPRELVEQIQKLFVIAITSAYGDGIVSGVANFSTSLNGISESMGTTMSATSAFFGARIAQLAGELKDWLAKNKVKYSGIGFGAL